MRRSGLWWSFTCGLKTLLHRALKQKQAGEIDQLHWQQKANVNTKVRLDASQHSQGILAPIPTAPRELTATVGARGNCRCTASPTRIHTVAVLTAMIDTEAVHKGRSNLSVAGPRYSFFYSKSIRLSRQYTQLLSRCTRTTSLLMANTRTTLV